MDSALPALADALEHELAARAQRCGWSTTPSDALVRTTVKSALDPKFALGTASDVPDGFELPRFRRAMELSPAALSILVCGLDADAMEASYRSALWWTGLVRSDISPSRRSDLHLFLIAPRGSLDDLAWRGRRSRIESDERFCRKFVWLPSSQPKSDEIDTFLDRTFLAKPWEGESAAPLSLDPLERLLDEFSSTNISREEAQAWINRLSVLDSAGVSGIAEDLVAIIGGKR
jgi:hypothetical protein